ncbi:MAG: hypothetical protein WCG51_03390, partial [Elusimicrobiota bacterium]
MFTHTPSSLVLRALLCGAQLLFILSPTPAFAEFGLPNASPYTFGPEGRTIQDLVDFAPPIQMVSFPAHQPIQATDQNGNKLFYNTNGKLMVSVSVDGSMVTYTSAGTRSFDAEGKLIEETKAIQGTNRSETRNDQGEITGYTTKAFGDKVAQEFDVDGNLTRTYAYTDYGKSTAWVRDELSQTKTMYNQLSQPEKDVDFEGNTVATYQYDAKKKIVSKTDVYNNVTSFDQSGRQAYTTNSKGEKVLSYDYKIDQEGNSVLEKTVDLTPGIYGGDVTTFHNNMQVKTVSKFGGVAQEYHYKGHTMVYSFDTRTNEVSWYKNGRQSVTTFDGEVVKEQLYYQSRFVGYIDHRSNRIVLYQYQRQDEEVKFFTAADMPTATEIEKYYESLAKMNDIVTTDVTPVKQSGGLVHQNTIPLNKPRVSLPRALALNPSKTETTFSANAKNSIVKSKYNYTGGKLLSIVSQDPGDGSGISTRVFVGDMSFTVTTDMSAQAAAFALLWNTIIAGKSIADISAGTDAMAGLARSVKSVNIPGDKIPLLSDIQLCNLFGWNINTENTRICLKDVRARATNSGHTGNLTVSYGYSPDNVDAPIYATTIMGTDANAFQVAGVYAGKMLDLTAEAIRVSLTVPGGPAVSLDLMGAPPGIDDTLPRELPAGVIFTQTTNGITRGYANNGNVLYEINTVTSEKTFFDNYARPTEVYGKTGLLDTAYAYSNNGTLLSIRTKSQEGYVTKFFLGFGVANEDQAEITVFGDQRNNVEAVRDMFDALMSGANLRDVDGSRMVRTIVLSPTVATHLSDLQLCNMFGWDPAASFTAPALADVRTRAANAGLEGKIEFNYGYLDENLYVCAVRAANQAGLAVPGNNDGDSLVLCDGVPGTLFAFSGSDTIRYTRYLDIASGKFLTTFFVGDGTDIMVTVNPDTTMDEIKSLYDAISNHIDTGSLASAATIRSISITPAAIALMNDNQLCALLSWDASAPNTSSYIADVRARATNAGSEGRVQIGYTTMGEHHFAASIGATDSGGKAVLGTIDGDTLSIESVDAHNNIVAAQYRITPL